MDIYEKYLVQAAISDQVCPLKENLALQELSTYLYNKDASYAKRASKYIYCSMEDAQFYNNRLRMVEISRILPLITETNHQAELRKNRIVTASLVIVSILSLGFLAMAFFAFRMNKQQCIRVKLLCVLYVIGADTGMNRTAARQQLEAFFWYLSSNISA